MITRSQVVGALKVCNANNVTNRRGFLQNMLAAEHGPKDVAKALRDIETYPEWSARADLEAAAPAGDAPVVAPAPKRKRK